MSKDFNILTEVMRANCTFYISFLVQNSVGFSLQNYFLLFLSCHLLSQLPLKSHNVKLLPQCDITKTHPCNVYPRETHFYIVKLGFAGVYLFLVFYIQNIDCGYSLEPPRRGGSHMYPQFMF